MTSDDFARGMIALMDSKIKEKAMPKPTEQEKKTKKIVHKTIGKMHVRGKTIDIEIETETTPNATGGYDTVVKMPMAFQIGANIKQEDN